MTSYIWKTVKLIVGTVCAMVLLFGPSEVQNLAIGQALSDQFGLTNGQRLALAVLGVVAIGSYVAAFTPRRFPHTTACALRLAGGGLIAYGMFAGVVKQLVALPTAGIAVAMGLLFIDRASTIIVTRIEDRR